MIFQVSFVQADPIRIRIYSHIYIYSFWVDHLHTLSLPKSSREWYITALSYIEVDRISRFCLEALQETNLVLLILFSPIAVNQGDYYGLQFFVVKVYCFISFFVQVQSMGFRCLFLFSLCLDILYLLFIVLLFKVFLILCVQLLC